MQAKQVQELQRQAQNVDVEIQELKQAATKQQQQTQALHRAEMTNLTWLNMQAKQVQELQRQAQDVDVEIRELKQAATKRQQQGAAVTRAFKSQKAALDALRTRRADLLGTAAMEQVSVTVCIALIYAQTCMSCVWKRSKCRPHVSKVAMSKDPPPRSGRHGLTTIVTGLLTAAKAVETHCMCYVACGAHC